VKELLKNPFYRFVFTAIGIYTVWFFIYEIWIHPWGKLDRLVIDNLIHIAGFFLQIIGYDLIPGPPSGDPIRTIGIDGTHGLWIGDPCNGITLFALFIIFVVAYPGPALRKLWFIPLGMIVIHLANVIRIIGLSIIVTYDYAYLDFNHNYTFTIFVYSFVFLLWYLWANKYSKVNSQQE
jgi:exosortase family protein XrtF